MMRENPASIVQIEKFIEASLKHHLSSDKYRIVCAVIHDECTTSVTNYYIAEVYIKEINAEDYLTLRFKWRDNTICTTPFLEQDKSFHEELLENIRNNEFKKPIEESFTIQWNNMFSYSSNGQKTL